MSFIDDKFNQMVAEHNGKKWEVVDSTNLNQCFDVVVGWNQYLGINPSTFGVLNAYQIFTTPNENTKKNFEIISNGLTNSPQKGDIVVWSSAYGPAGHTAVASGVGNIFSFQVFSQNDPTGSVCTLKTYNFGWPSKVLGWLRPKNVVAPVPVPAPLTVKQLTILLNEAVAAKRWE